MPGGFFIVPNWHIDRLLPLLSPVEWAVLCVVQRQTVGWQKRRDAIALSQFYELVPAGRQAIREALDALAAFGVLIRTDRPGKPPVYEIADVGAVDWVGLVDRRNSWDAETNRRTIAGRIAAARARGDVAAETPTDTGQSDAIFDPCRVTTPPPLPSHGRGTPAVITAHTKNTHTQERQGEGKAIPPALDFSSRENSAGKMPDSRLPASSAANAPATPLADAFDRERRAIVGRLAPGVWLIPMPSADRPRIEAQLMAAAVTLAEVPALVAWMAAHDWDRRRDLLRHCGPMAHEKVTLPLVNDWRADTATAGAAPLPKFDPAAEQRRDAEARADRERQARYLAALRAGALPDRATVEAGCDVTAARVQGWRRDAEFIAAERAAFDAGEIVRAEQARSRPRRDWRDAIAADAVESEAADGC